MRVKAHYSQNETEAPTRDNNKAQEHCTICKNKYFNPMYISAQSFGGSCVNCRPKYLNIVNDILKNGLI